MNKKRKILFGIGLVIFLVSGASYSIFWWKTAHYLENNLQEWAKAMQQQGYEVAYEKFEGAGFPFKLEVILKNPSLRYKGLGVFSFKTQGDVHIQSSLFRVQQLTWLSKSPTYITYGLSDKDEKQIAINVSTLSARVNTWGAGLNRQALLTLQDVSVKSATMHAHADKLLLENFEVETPTRLKIDLQASNINPGVKLSPPFNRDIQSLNLIFRFDINKPLTSKNISTFLKALSSEGGTVEIENIELAWGKLIFKANGTLTLDEVQQPIASFSASIQGLDLILDQLAEQKVIKPHIAHLAKLTFSFLKKPSSDLKDSSSHQISLSYQNGEFSLGNLTLFRFPPIRWFTQNSNSR
jgi:hypothetical protein